MLPAERMVGRLVVAELGAPHLLLMWAARLRSLVDSSVVGHSASLSGGQGDISASPEVASTLTCPRVPERVNPWGWFPMLDPGHQLYEERAWMVPGSGRTALGCRLGKFTFNLGYFQKHQVKMSFIYVLEPLKNLDKRSSHLFIQIFTCFS